MGTVVGRRRFLGALAGAAALAGCGIRGPLPGSVASQDPNDRSIVWANWTLYLDYDRKTRSFPTLDRFMAESGFTVDYREDIDDNVSFNGKVAPQLVAGDGHRLRPRHTVRLADRAVDQEAVGVTAGQGEHPQRRQLQGAREQMERIDPELAESEWIFPSDELLAKAQVFRDFTAEEEVAYNEAFGRVIQS